MRGIVAGKAKEILASRSRKFRRLFKSYLIVHIYRAHVVNILYDNIILLMLRKWKFCETIYSGDICALYIYCSYVFNVIGYLIRAILFLTRTHTEIVILTCSFYSWSGAVFLFVNVACIANNVIILTSEFIWFHHRCTIISYESRNYTW